MAVNVTIDGDGLHFTGDTDLSKAGTIISFLTDDQSRLSMAISSSATLGKPVTKTLRQIVVDLGASKNPEKIAAFVRYLLDKGGRDHVTLKDIDVSFTRSGESKPKNIYRDIKKAIMSGYIAESDDRAGYILTDLGIELTESGFKV